MKSILSVVLVCILTVQIADAQYFKQVFVWHNTSGMMLQASPPIVLDDSSNFHVRCLDKLPLLLSAGDSLSFEGILLASDGLPHSTMIHFHTSAGTASLAINMLAEYNECKLADKDVRIVELGHPHPNPANGVIYIPVAGNEPGARLEFYSLSVGVLLTVPLLGQDEYAIATNDLPRGTYFVSLIAGKELRGVEMVVVEH
jgi:hypothetical protein